MYEENRLFCRHGYFFVEDFAVRPGEEVQEVVTDKRSHSQEMVWELKHVGLGIYVSERDRGRQRSEGQLDGQKARCKDRRQTRVRRASGCSVSGPNGWNDRLPISSRREGCAGSSSGAMLVCASGCRFRSAVQSVTFNASAVQCRDVTRSPGAQISRWSGYGHPLKRSGRRFGPIHRFTPGDSIITPFHG